MCRIIDVSHKKLERHAVYLSAQQAMAKKPSIVAHAAKKSDRSLSVDNLLAKRSLTIKLRNQN
jgi:hypothetical protein